MDNWVSADDPFCCILSDLLELFILEGEDRGITERPYHHNEQVCHLSEVCGVALAGPHIDKDVAAVAQNHVQGEKAFLCPEEEGMCSAMEKEGIGSHYEDVGDHKKHHGGQHKEQEQEEVPALKVAGVGAGKLEDWSSVTEVVVNDLRATEPELCFLQGGGDDGEESSHPAGRDQLHTNWTIHDSCIVQRAANGHIAIKGHDCGDQEVNAAQRETRERLDKTVRDMVL